MHLDVSTNASSLAANGARHLAGILRMALAHRSTATIALSGGTTPVAMFEALLREELDWSKVHVFQVDERVAPDGDPARNANQLSAFAAAGATVHLMDVTAADLPGACRRYAEELQVVCGGVLDAVHLGLGEDGHTASWAPGDPVLAVVDTDVALTRPFNGHVRMTLTVPCINRAGDVMFLVEGAAKAAVARLLVEADNSIPASRVREERTSLFADQVVFAN